MTLTIFYSNSKAKQVIKLHETFSMDEKGNRINPVLLHKKAKEIAFDITKNNYLGYFLDMEC